MNFLEFPGSGLFLAFLYRLIGNPEFSGISLERAFPWSSFPCFFGKSKENHPKKQGFFLGAEPLKSLGKKGKTLKKARKFLATKKARKSKKARKGRSGLGSPNRVFGGRWSWYVGQWRLILFRRSNEKRTRVGVLGRLLWAVLGLPAALPNGICRIKCPPPLLLEARTLSPPTAPLALPQHSSRSTPGFPGSFLALWAFFPSFPGIAGFCRREGLLLFGGFPPNLPFLAKQPKRQGFFFPGEPLNFLENKEKAVKKTRNSCKWKKKQGTPKKQGKEDQGIQGLAFDSRNQRREDRGEGVLQSKESW